MFLDRLEQLISEKGITHKAFLQDVNINKNAFSFWKKGAAPTKATLTVIAGYFGVSVEYLLGETEDRGTKKPSALTEEQLAIVMKVTSLSPKNQEEAMRYLDFLISRQENG